MTAPLTTSGREREVPRPQAGPMRLVHDVANVRESVTAPLAISGRVLEVSRPQAEPMQ